ncbi:putative fluoride ion transporter CrcB [Posidoniimonas polymericola]|uniref:Fluoride-specific ion channel FluC n=1 Tax=Posidoniimonas polymericola TaxID=2528002 RepID=A0A5C5YFH3_9BACT|nr:CrcB family protein [Posidoniimonas polymericola]TWT74477.1 putative fluoride ion transporter CrcB [Posidoniimonas polymericola]
MTQLLAIAIGGALGALCRHGVALALVGTRFAYATLLVNVAGCFVLGALVHNGLAGDGRLKMLAHPAVTVGYLGALTTFSTFSFQTIVFLEERAWLLAAINVAANLVLGLLATVAGMALSRALAAPAV